MGLLITIIAVGSILATWLIVAILTYGIVSYSNLMHHPWMRIGSGRIWLSILVATGFVCTAFWRAIS